MIALARSINELCRQRGDALMFPTLPEETKAAFFGPGDLPPGALHPGSASD
jgi:hypothetical protein